MNLKECRHIHFTGIKGVGMTSLALCMQDLGVKISGSDTKEVFVTDEVLRKRKISWSNFFGSKNLIPKPDLVITTGAHGGLRNPEVAAAIQRGIPVLTHAEALGQISKGREVVAVCGVGGKTTTASMIATILSGGSLHPSFAIGVGNIYPLGVPGKFDAKGRYFICEADEYATSPGVNNKPRFSYIKPMVLVVSNIEHDHPDIYPSLADTKRVFRGFFERVPADGLLVACKDNPNVVDTLKGLKVPMVTYGFNDKADWRITDVRFDQQKTRFSLVSGEEQATGLTIKIPGEFNVQNAAAAFIVSRFCSLSLREIRDGLTSYKGCRRRFEKIGRFSGAEVYDDYAHHPKEIRAVLAAAKQWFPKKRIIAVFQPHTYSRTRTLFTDFSQSFVSADIVVFMDIYSSAREKVDPGVSSKKLAEAVSKVNLRVFYTGTQKKTLQWLRVNCKRGDILLTLGAGDIFHLHEFLKG